MANEKASDRQWWYPEWPANKCRTDSGLVANEQVLDRQWSHGQRASVGQAVILWPTSKCRTGSGITANEQVSDRQWRYPEWPAVSRRGTNCQEEIVVVSNEPRIQSLSLEPTRWTDTAPPTCSARTQNCNNGPRSPLTGLSPGI